MLQARRNPPWDLTDKHAVAAAIGKQDWRVAESALIAAKGQFAQAEPSERVDVLHGLATVQLALKRPCEALVTLRAALKLAPNVPEVHYALGRAHEALDANAQARREYRAAIDLGLKEPQAVVARQKLDALDPLSSSEWFGWLAARALSMQNHGIFASAHYAPSDRLTLSLELGPSITYIGGPTAQLRCRARMGFGQARAFPHRTQFCFAHQRIQRGTVKPGLVAPIRL